MYGKTIFALSSGHPPAGVCVIRVSGPKARDSLKKLANIKNPIPRKMVKCDFILPNDKNVIIDSGLSVWFPGPKSFTGEDCAELHIHGSVAVVKATLAALEDMRDFELAEAGEFTRRAFENGKLNLSEVEGLSDLIASQTEKQRLQALKQLSGELGTLCQKWQNHLKAALAEMEATIDFSDEDLPDKLDTGAREQLQKVYEDIRGYLLDNRSGEIIREGINIAILGAPNVGKSSLLNTFAHKDAAIVSKTEGTTRDIIEVPMDMGGYPVILADTAGLRKGDSAIEVEGVKRALKRAKQSDIQLIVFDGQEWPHLESRTLNLLSETAIGVLNKIDIVSRPIDRKKMDEHGLIGISTKTGEGINKLISAMIDMIEKQYGLGEATVITRARHRDALEKCDIHLGRAINAVGSELWSEDVRLALRELGKIVGQVGVEDLLDMIFLEFCIGK